MTLTRQIMTGLVLGIVTAALLAGPLAPWRETVLAGTGVAGTLFLNALKMVGGLMLPMLK